MATSAHARLDPAWFKQMKSLGLPADPHRAAMRAHLKEWIGYYWLLWSLSSFLARKSVISGNDASVHRYVS
jgi:hypothetical protein